MPSPALETLREQRLPEIQALLGARPAIDLPHLAMSSAAQAINRAAVVLLTAHLEGFVEELVVDVIDALNKAEPSTALIPKVLLAAHVIDEVTVIAGMTQIEQRANRLEQLFLNRSSLWLNQTLEHDALQAGPVTASLGNPGAKEIARTLGLLGMSDVFSQAELPDGADPEKRVNEIVGIRNAIAHGEGTGVGDQQVESYVRSVAAVAEELERVAAGHVQAISGIATLPWS